MLKTHFSKLLCLTLALQFVIPAQVFATATDPSQQRQEVLNKAHELLNHPAAQNAELRDANKAPLSHEQFLAQNPSDFYMLPSGTLNGAPYAIRVKSTLNADRELVVAIAIMDQNLRTTFTRRSLTLHHSQSSTQQLVEIERAVNTMVQSLQTAATQGKTKRTVASRSEGSEVRAMVQRAIMLCWGLAACNFALMLIPDSSAWGSTRRDRYLVRGFVLICVAGVLVFISGGGSPEESH